MFEKLFPLNLDLKIFQLEGYDPIRLFKWIFKNFLVRKIEEKRKLILTPKAKLIKLFFIFSLILIFSATFLVSKNILISLLFTILIASQPYLILAMSSLLFIPLEYIYKLYIIQKTRNKILSFKNLKVIGITGSYGKSSTKEMLYQLIKNNYKVLKTPESYNTILGISKVVDYELDDSYDFFICEMAAYHIHDIKRLCYMVPPKYGILTGIAPQHLERFKTLKNIIKTKFELSDAVNNSKNMLYNTSNREIADELQRRHINIQNEYLKAKGISFTSKGSEFTLIYNNKEFKVKTPIFGYSNIENLLGAIKMATLIGVDIKTILKKVNTLEQIPNRFRITKYGKATFVDNTFSSNVSSFNEMIKTAKTLKGTKILITPGLVELGNFEKKIHFKLGQKSKKVFDKVILVGRNNRTLAFSDGLKESVEFIEDSRADYFKKISEAKDKFDWVFLENDITENY